MSNYSADPPSVTRVRKHRIRKPIWLAVLLVAATVTSWSQSSAPVIETIAPDLDATLQSVERMQQQNPAHFSPYEVTRKYKIFRADDKQPISEVTAQISFTPPDTKTYTITQASGRPVGGRMVRAILDQETAAAKISDNNEINRRNYDFVFLRRENFGAIPAYVLLIIPKRKAKNLLLGQIWVDASTFRIWRIEGIPGVNPSIWIKNIHITLQFAELRGAWIPVSFDAIATIRLLGQYTLVGLNVEAPTKGSIAP